MQCPQCRQVTPDDAAFCGNCGAPLTVGSAELAGQSQTVAVAVPAEAVMTGVRDHSAKAILAFGIGLIGLVAWLVPIAGLVVGFMAMICGTVAFHSRRRVFARSGIALSVIVLAASLFMWVHSAQRLRGTADAAPTASQQTVVTPCYSTRVSGRLQISRTDSCSFQAADPAAGEQLAVKVVNVPGLSASNLSDAAAADAANVVRSVKGGRLTSEASALFAGSVAYQAVVTAGDGSGGMLEYVYNPTPQGNLLVLTHSQVHLTASNHDLSLLETNWSWQ